MKRAAKTGIKIVVVLYVAVITAFAVTAVQRAEPKNKTALLTQLQEQLNALRQQAYRDDPDHIRSRPINPKEAADVLESVIQKRGNIISINYTLIMQWLNFAILLLLLYGFFWDPLVRFLDERRRSIDDEIARAEHTRRESEKLLEQRRRELAHIKQERADIIEQAKREAARERERLREQAQQEAEHIAREVRERLDEEVRRARKELRSEVAQLASQIAEKILARELTRQDHDRIFEDMIKQLSSDGLEERE